MSNSNKRCKLLNNNQRKVVMITYGINESYENIYIPSSASILRAHLNNQNTKQTRIIFNTNKGDDDDRDLSINSSKTNLIILTLENRAFDEMIRAY